MFSCETPAAFFSPSHSLFYFLSSLTSSVGMWLSEREKKRLEKCRTNEWAERRMVSREGGLQCGVARQAEEEEADCRVGVALHRRGPLIKSEGQTWELTQASAAASQRRRRGGSCSPTLTPSVRPAGLLAPARDGGRAGRRQLVWLSV